LRLGSEASNENYTVQDNSNVSVKYKQNFHKKNYSIATENGNKSLNQRVDTGDHSAKVSTQSDFIFKNNNSQGITFHDDTTHSPDIIPKNKVNLNASKQAP
jgi:hypothetical protein